MSYYAVDAKFVMQDINENGASFQYYYRNQSEGKEFAQETNCHDYAFSFSLPAPTPPTTMDYTCQNLFFDGCFPVCSGFADDDCPGLLVPGFEYLCDSKPEVFA